MKKILKTIYQALAALPLVFAAGACDMIQTEDAHKPDPADLVLQVQSTDRLYTTEYVVHKVVSYDDIIKMRGSVLDRNFEITLPQGKRKVLIPMEARIKAYIDFGGFSESNVKINPDSTITVTLPDPQIDLTSTRIDHAGIKSYVDFGRSRFSQSELSDFERQGRTAIINTIPDLGIIETARADAYHLIRPMVETMGYKPEQITIEFRNDLSTTDYLKNLYKD